MTRDPVVAPAGTVLRVRLMERPETGEADPGIGSEDVERSMCRCKSVGKNAADMLTGMNEVKRSKSKIGGTKTL